MSYSTDCAALIAGQLERLATQNPHQLAGQAANLQFWVSEAVHAVETIEDYPRRYRRLRDAQTDWVDRHHTKASEYCPICGGGCEFRPQTPSPPRRISHREFEVAREDVRRGLRRFVLRLYRSELIAEEAVRQACERVGAGIEAEDLERD